MSSSLDLKWIPGSLSGRLTFYFSLTFIALLVITIAGLYFSLGSLLDQQLADDWQEDMEVFQQLYKTGGIQRVKDEILHETFKPEDQRDEFFQLYTTAGELLFSSPGDIWKPLKLLPKTIQGRNARDFPMIETIDFEHSEYPIRTYLGKIDENIYLYSGETIAGRQDILNQVVQAFLIALLFIIPLASVTVWWIAVKSSRDIEIISRSVAEIEQGNLESRVQLDTPVTELSQLANTFNGMADRIKSLIHEMREMIDNIAHDLRSPLGRIRAISENALISAQKPSEYITAAENTLGECDRLLRLINTTLDVAEVEAGVYQGDNLPVDMSQVVSEACDLFEPVAQGKNLKMTITNLESCTVQGNLNNLQRMLSNLIDNAIKYTPEQGSIRINMIKNNEGCRIVVADTGIGISEINQPRVFERFYRCDNSRATEGCGLGLSFSKAVARQYGGDITLESKPDDSTVFTVLLPC